MSRRQCCVWGCHNRKGRCAEDIDGNRLCGCPTLQMQHCPKRDILSLYTIECMPQHVKRAVVLKINLTRQGPKGTKWQPTGESVICNVHYADFKGPTKDNKDVVPINFKRPSNYPSVSPAPKRKRLSKKSLATLPSRHVDVTIPQTDNLSIGELVCSHIDYGEQQQSSNLSNVEQSDVRSIHQDSFTGDQGNTQSIYQGSLSIREQDNVDSSSLSIDTDVTVATHHTNEGSTEDAVRVDVRIIQLEQENRELRAENIRLKQTIEAFNSTVQRLNLKILSDFQVQMYTGISRKAFECIINWLEPVSRKKGAVDELSPTQKFLLVLMRLRHNLSQTDLACRFNIEQSSVSRILNSWIPLLSAQLKGLIKWPQTTIGPTDPPYNLLPNAVAIIDGTEIFIQRPSNLTTQKSSYSDYKSHTTVKYLVAIDTFTGVFVFVSPGFSGSSSDRFTIQYSGFLNELKPGQRILADKGYNVRDLFAQKRCFLTIPSFLNDGRLAAEEAMQSRTIASVRIRVENAIKKLKEYKVFNETICNRINKQIVDDMMVIVCALCNLKQKLI